MSDQTLAECRETNRRLQRRVQSLEGPVFSNVAEAQQHTRLAQAQTHLAQERLGHVQSQMMASHRQIDMDHSTICGLAIAASVLFLYGVAMTVTTIFLFFH